VGVAAFRLKSFVRMVPGKLYAGGEVETIENHQSAPPDLTEALAHLFDRLHELLATGHSRARTEEPNLSFKIAQECGLTLGQRLQLLAMPEEERRQYFLMEHLKMLIPVLEATEETKDRLRANGRFHKFPKLDL
jgi:hypothetical protein